MIKVIFIGVGGGVGSILRYLLAGVIQRGQTGFPTGTFAVNVLGCLAIGFLAARFADSPIDPRIRVAVLVGVLGGFTTYSTFGLETLELAKRGAFVLAGLNAVGTLLCCLVGVWVGQRIALVLAGGQ